ncbi:MAG: hypothetical protein LUG12_11470 [Erysipelotrichaceae bacterium]|nr:hypothetical protein [Erysipelotrichaceae bacterium]
MIFICFGILAVSLILALYANSLQVKKQQKMFKFIAYGLVLFDILLAFFA